ncbi:complex I NDUFA9 subunit family protein [Persephonella atlantica]|uniref:Complex I NDUFA9 subunit family protein n=1 Tax=Persephonella atlantica TaxID=2699429 RepID=A0ABS1GFG6_9AQUI|nr:complex I NDUFA9 subunit family protein [Persephonella atlantica]MBK3331673.1 complex I NDUFA9 subunit family protein [Persephonella atlantica]
MKILITGGTGFVGRHVVEDLEREYHIIVPTRRVSKAQLSSGVEFIPFSKELGSVVKQIKPDVIINCLGILKEEKGETFEKVHVEYVKKLLQGAKEIGLKRFIHISALGADINSKSRYAKTKAEGEQIIKNSGIDYIILRPSIILGKGQKLFEDLKKFSKLTPVIFAPEGNVQPVHVLDVVDTIRKGIEDEKFKNIIIELCGNRIVSYKELFEFALSYIGKKRIVIQMPSSFFWFMLPVFRFFPEPPVTEDQLYLLEKDNVCSGNFPTQKNILGKVRNPFRI